MAAPEREIVEVRVNGARADLGAITFVPGVPTQPFSVGANGQWKVVGNGVGLIHLFLGFDGQQVHVVAASQNLPVMVAGRPIGGSWVTAPVPGEIRFGSACLMMRRAPASVAAANPDAAPSTVSDGGALWQAAQRAAHYQSNPPAPNTPAGLQNKGVRSTMLMEHRPNAPIAVSPPAFLPIAVQALPPDAPVPGATPDASTDQGASKRGYWKSASVVKKITLVLMPIALLFSFLMLRDDDRSASRTVSGQAGTSSRVGAPEAAPSAPTNASVGDTAAAQRDPGVPAPADKADVARGTEAPKPAFPIFPVASTPRPVFAARQGKRTPEREALETVANGSLDEAARDYDSLAAAHPDDPSFREAARILHAKVGHVH